MFSSFLLYLFRDILAPHFSLSGNKSESILTKCETSKDYGAKIKGGYCLPSLLWWQHAAFTHSLGLLKPALSSHLHRAQHQHVSPCPPLPVRISTSQAGRHRKRKNLLNILTQDPHHPSFFNPFATDNSTEFRPKQKQ